MGQIADLIAAALAGDKQPDSLGPSWRHDLAMPIYERAEKILAMAKDDRRAEIESHPAEIQKLLADEVKRLYRLRKYRDHPQCHAQSTNQPAP